MASRSSADRACIVYQRPPKCSSSCLRNRSKLPYRLILLTFICIRLAGPIQLAAQTTSILQGTVSDQQHLAITDATITLSSATLPRDIKTSTDAGGSYRIPGLLPGSYDLRV